MKKQIAWVTDSTAYITEELRNNPDVYVIPMAIIFGKEVYEDGVTITEDTLYKKIKESGEFPTTSQPPTGVYISLYEELKEKYETVIIIHVSGLISGTFSGSVQAAKMVGLNYYAIDSLTMSYALTYMLEEGIKLQEEGRKVEDIVKHVELMVPTVDDYIALGSLKQMYKGGRMGGMQFIVGTILNIKPVIKVNKEGAFEMVDKIRTEKKALKYITDQFTSAREKFNVTRAAIVHGNKLEEAMKWKGELMEKCPDLSIDVAPISSTIGVHAGEGTLAMIWLNK